MITFTGTPQASLVSKAALAIGPPAFFTRVFARLASLGMSPGLLVLIPVAAKSIIGKHAGAGWVKGEGLLCEVLDGDWQTLLGLPDALAQSVAVSKADRVLIAEAILAEAAVVASEEAARLTALLPSVHLPDGWDAVAIPDGPPVTTDGSGLP